MTPEERKAYNRTPVFALMVDAWEAGELEQLVDGRLLTAESNARGLDGEPVEFQRSEAADVPRLRVLLERIRYIKRQLERSE